MLQLLFRNGEHYQVFAGSIGMAMDSTPLTTAGFTQHARTAILNGDFVGTVFRFISNSSFSGVENEFSQPYLS